MRLRFAFHHLTLLWQLRFISAMVSFGALTLSAQALYSIWEMHAEAHRTMETYSMSVTLNRDINEANIAFREQVRQFRNILLRGHDADELSAYRKHFDTAEEETHQALSRAKQSAHDFHLSANDPVLEKVITDLDYLENVHDGYSSAYRAAITHFAPSKDVRAADAMVLGLDQAFVLQLKVLSDTVGRFNQERLALENQLGDENYRLHWWLTIGLGLLLAASIALLLTLARKSVFRRVGGEPIEVEEIVKSVAAGNLSYAVTEGGVKKGLLGEVLTMSENLRKVLIDLHASAANLSNTSFHLADSANRMASTVNEQNDAVQNMQQSTAQLNLSIQHIADNSNEAQQIAEATQQAAVKGAHIVKQTVEEMAGIANSIADASNDISRLGDKSQRISAVVGTIRDIADQTNLLALNAAIEAARAGEQGRGFAVVADEVRKLAERTSAATREIQSFSNEIGNVVTQAIARMERVVADAKAGALNAQLANDSINEIQQAFNSVAQQIGNISHALTEQSSMSRELENSINRVAGISAELQSATTLIAETANNFSGLAGQTIEVVGGFKLGNEKVDDVTLF
jgi:methyl-accepting chemotaxis protein